MENATPIEDMRNGEYDNYVFLQPIPSRLHRIEVLCRLSLN